MAANPHEQTAFQVVLATLQDTLENLEKTPIEKKKAIDAFIKNQFEDKVKAANRLYQLYIENPTLENKEAADTALQELKDNQLEFHNVLEGLKKGVEVEESDESKNSMFAPSTVINQYLKDYQKQVLSIVQSAKKTRETSIHMPANFKDVNEYFHFFIQIKDLYRDLEQLRKVYIEKIKKNESTENIQKAFNDYARLNLEITASMSSIKEHSPVALKFWDIFVWGQIWVRLNAYLWGIKIINQAYLQEQKEKITTQFKDDIYSEISNIAKEQLKSAPTENIAILKQLENPSRLENLTSTIKRLQEGDLKTKLLMLANHIDLESSKNFEELKRLAGDLSTFMGEREYGRERSGTLKDFFKEISDATTLEKLSKITLQFKEKGYFRSGTLTKLKQLLESNSDQLKNFQAFQSLLINLQTEIPVDANDIFNKMAIRRPSGLISQEIVTDVFIQDILKDLPAENQERIDYLFDKLSEYLVKLETLNSASITNLIEKFNKLNLSEAVSSAIIDGLNRVKSTLEQNNISISLPRIMKKLELVPITHQKRNTPIYPLVNSMINILWLHMKDAVPISDYQEDITKITDLKNRHSRPSTQEFQPEYDDCLSSLYSFTNAICGTNIQVPQQDGTKLKSQSRR